MGKRGRIAVAVLAAAIAGMVLWRALHAHERGPFYRGKSLEGWLRQYGEARSLIGSERTKKEAEDAVRQIGTNAMPYLLDMLRKSDSRSISKLVELWNQRVKPNWLFPNWVRHPAWYERRAAVLNFEGSLGFEILGADAQQAVPGLISLYEQDISPDSEKATISALIAIGPAARAAVPLLVRDAGSSDDSVRVNAVRALVEMHAEPSMVVPVFVKGLNDTNRDVCSWSARGLRDSGASPQQTVPSLLRLLSDPGAGYLARDAAIGALNRIDPGALKAAGIPALINLLKDADSLARWQGAVFLERFGNDSQGAVPALVLLLRDSHGDVRSAVSNALKTIDPGAAAKAGVNH
jgi:hypothetical protein